MVKQIIDVHSVSFHEVALDEKLFVSEAQCQVCKNYSYKAEKFHIGFAHVPVHEYVVTDLKGKVYGDTGDERQSVRHIVESHDLLKNVQLAKEW